MKKYIILSLAIHLALVFFSFKASKAQDEAKQEEKKNQAFYPKEERIIEIVDQVTTEATKPEPKKEFYWGIGIYSVSNTTSTGAVMLRVTSVVSGYAAETAGIRIDDIIISIDDQDMTETNNIRGDKPRRMVLTVVRNGATIRITLERTKVYF